MLDFILNFIETIVVLFGYGTVNYFTFLFWSVILLYSLEKFYKTKINASIKVKSEDVKDIQEEKTEE